MRDDNIRLTPQVYCQRCNKSESLSQSDDVWLFIGNYVFVALGIQSFHIWALWTPADSGGHSGCWGPLHRPSDPHWEGDWLWRWQPRYLSTSCILFLLRTWRIWFVLKLTNVCMRNICNDCLCVVFQVCVAWLFSSTLTCVIRSVGVWASLALTCPLLNLHNWTTPTNCWFVLYNQKTSLC